MSYVNKISTARGIKYVKMFVLSEYGRFTFILTVGVPHHVWHIEENVSLFKVITLNTYIISKFILILAKIIKYEV